MKPNKDIEKELNELSPLLAELREREEGYRVPQDYFSTLADEILEKCEETPEVEVQGPSVMERLTRYVEGLLQPRYALAFATVLLLVVGAVVFFPEQNTESLAGLEEVTQAELLAYFDDNIDEFDFDLLEAGYDELDFGDALDIETTTLEDYIDENILEDLDETILEDLL